MSTTSLTITNLQNDMTSDEVKQKLAKLYNAPEEHFEGVCKSLVVLNEPYVLLKKVEQSLAEKHVQRLTKIGFNCSLGDEFGGLSLAPVVDRKTAEVICPACDQPAGCAEICEQCGVIIHKFLKQKKFDEQFQNGINAANNSQARRLQHDAERSKRQSEQDKAKRRNNTIKDNSLQSTDEQDEMRVDSNKISNKLVYAAVASVCFLVAGTGYFIYGFVNKQYLNDGFIASAESELSTGSSSSNNESATLAFIDEKNQAESVQQTIFGKKLERDQKLRNLGQSIRRMYEEDMVLSATYLVSGKEDSRDRLFGNQELIKIKGLNQESAQKLIDNRTLALEFDNDVDRITALLHQSDVYIHFELFDEATQLYDEAAKIAFEIADSVEERIIAEITIAEYQLQHGDSSRALKRYQIAKDKATELEQLELADAAFGYIALSEAGQGLTEEANTTAEILTDAEIRKNLLLEINKILAKSKSSTATATATATATENAATNEQLEKGDPQLDKLIEMTEKNKRIFETANSVLGQ